MQAVVHNMQIGYTILVIRQAKFVSKCQHIWKYGMFACIQM